MAGKRKAPAKKKTEATLEMDENGQWWIVSGSNRTDAGRSRRYAEKLLAEANA